MRRHKTILVTGGARSGKSRYALSLAAPFRKKTLIATLEPKDEEMKARIKKHKSQRGRDWLLIEEPLNLAKALKRAFSKSDCVVVDCITLWLTNLLLAGKKEQAIIKELEQLCGLVSDPPCLVAVVSNEVGLGIVPADALTRLFRDLQGAANQMLAQAAQEMVMMVAGVPVRIKGRR